MEKQFFEGLNTTPSNLQLIYLEQEKLEFIENSLNEILTFIRNSEKVKTDYEKVTIKESAIRLGVCQKTLMTYLKQGKIPYFQFKSKIYLKPSDIDNFMNKHIINNVN